MYLVISISISIPAQIFFTFGLAGGLNTFTPHGLLKILYSIVRLEKTIVFHKWVCLMTNMMTMTTLVMMMMMMNDADDE